MMSLRSNVQLVLRPEEKNREKSKKENYGGKNPKTQIRKPKPNKHKTKPTLFSFFKLSQAKTMNLETERVH